MIEVTRLYPQYQAKPDRRQNSIPVAFDRRSGLDRRQVERFQLDNSLRTDIYQTRSLIKNTNDDSSLIADGVASAIPFTRRIAGILDSFREGEHIKALGRTFIQIINVKEDTRDVKAAARQIANKDLRKFDYQMPFSFTRGTALENIECLRGLRRIDTTMFDTSLVQKFLKKIGMTEVKAIETSRLNKFGDAIFAFKAEGKPIAQLAARAMMRVPVLSIAFLMLLELPKVITSETPIKQTIKSTINVASIVTFGAVLGAIGAYAGPAGSLIGLGLGSLIGSKAAKTINKLF